jgi:hypothetical protein
MNDIGLVRPRGDNMRNILQTSLVAILGILLLGCDYGALAMKGNKDAAINRDALVNLQPGMSPKDVVQVMGTGPFSTEFFRGKNGEGVLVYKYITRPTSFGTQAELKEENLIPLIFVDNVLEGWGWSYLETASQRYDFVTKVKNR